MIEPSAVVFVIDDDASIRKSIARLLRSAGLEAVAFSSAAEFLEYQRTDAAGCLLLDVQMPGLSGLELQYQLNRGQRVPPIIFISGHGDVPMTAKAMKAGAIDFLTKPYSPSELLDAVHKAIHQDRRNRERHREQTALYGRLDSLSPREREVLGYVVAGMLNKQVAGLLRVTEKTVKVHRGQVMRKMQAGSVAQLVRMAEKLGIEGPDGGLELASTPTAALG